MIFSNYEYTRSTYYAYKSKNFHLYMCAERALPNKVWFPPFFEGCEPDNYSLKRYFLYKFPDVEDFTEEVYKQLKANFIRYIKSEQLKMKMNKINEDF